VEESRMTNFSYYGIVLKTTLPTNDRIGRFVKFSEDQHWFDWQPANVEDVGIKWTFTLNTLDEYPVNTGSLME